jgi:hypothetical protein
MNCWTSKYVKMPTSPFQMRQMIVAVISLPTGDTVGCNTVGPRSGTAPIELSFNSRMPAGRSARCCAAAPVVDVLRTTNQPTITGCR